MPSDNVLMKKPSKTVPALPLFAVVLLVLLLTGSCSDSGDVPEPEVLEELGLMPLPGDRVFPDIAFRGSDGTVRNLSEFNGSVVLLNFWATWCPPCRAEIPSMGRLYERLGNDGFSLLAVNVREPAGLVEAFAEEFEMNFPYYLDEAGEAAEAVGITGIPTSILIDRDGIAAAVVVGALEWDDEKLLEALENWID